VTGAEVQVGSGGGRVGRGAGTVSVGGGVGLGRGVSVAGIGEGVVCGRATAGAAVGRTTIGVETEGAMRAGVLAVVELPPVVAGGRVGGAVCS